jgi:hypothetical protein
MIKMGVGLWVMKDQAQKTVVLVDSVERCVEFMLR